jgi:hypothetical protein
MKREALQDPTFWLHLVATLIGAVSTSGLVTDDHWLKIMGLGLVLLNALGAGHAYGDADPNAPKPPAVPLETNTTTTTSTAVPGLDRSPK